MNEQKEVVVSSLSEYFDISHIPLFPSHRTPNNMVERFRKVVCCHPHKSLPEHPATEAGTQEIK